MMSRPTLRLGDISHHVRELQRLLNDELEADDLKVDGHFGPLTQEAVRAHQARSIGPDGSPLLVDGIVGPVTWWSLTTDVQPVDVSERLRIGKPRCALGQKTLDVAIEEVEAGAREIGENNAGEFVEKYLGPGGRTEGAWCAGFISYCVHEAAKRLGIPPPFAYSLGARQILRRLTDAGLALEDGEDPQPGDVMVWWRDSPDSWMGHVELVTAVEAGMVWTTGGNRGKFPAPVKQFSYVLERERKLLGFAKLCE